MKKIHAIRVFNGSTCEKYIVGREGTERIFLRDDSTYIVVRDDGAEFEYINVPLEVMWIQV